MSLLPRLNPLRRLKGPSLLLLCLFSPGVARGTPAQAAADSTHPRTAGDSLTILLRSFRLRESFPPPADSSSAVDTSRSREDSLGRSERDTEFSGATLGEGFSLAGFRISGSKSVSVSGGGRGAGSSSNLDQNLMLEISGKLSRDTRLDFRLNDQDLALVSEGRSAELRELDEVRLSITSPGASVSLGDYDFRLEGYRFARVERKLDGAWGSLNRGPVKLGASAALSGGTFRSMRFNGTEGRQGPYQLTGDSGEPVRILAGTERVYLDGRLLRRGIRADYTIDYNRGTLHFTDRRIIGPESRIEADYEYSSFTYKKALYSVTGETGGKMGFVRGYFLRESDLQDSPLAGFLTAEEQGYLEDTGAGLDSLLGRGVRFVGEDRGTYRMSSEGSGEPYFIYTGPGLGDYSVSFVDRGHLRGSYEYDPVSVSYRYVGPGLGDFEPAGEVTPPSRDDRAGAAFELRPLAGLRVGGEGAVLSHAANLYSSGGGNLNATAHNLFVELDTLGLPRLPARLSLRAGDSRTGGDFTFQGRRYEADFERRWHLDPLAAGSRGTGEKTREGGAVLHLPAGLELGGGWAGLERTSGEQADRRDYSVSFAPAGFIDARWEKLNVHSDRLPADTSGAGGQTVRGYRDRDNFEANLRLGRITPRLTVEREERTGPGYTSLFEGSRHLHLEQQLGLELSPRFGATLGFSTRRTDRLRETGTASGGDGAWERESRWGSGQLGVRYQGSGAFRVNGRLAHRVSRAGEALGGERTSSTAGRVEVTSAALAGALQSHVVYDISHGASLRNRVVYLPERYPDEGEYLGDGTYVGREQGTHRREIVPAEADSRQAEMLDLTARENLDLTAWVDSSRERISRMSLGTTLRLERESTADDSWRLYCLLPSALDDSKDALFKSTWINSDLTVQWKDPDIYTRMELVWNTRLDRRFEQGSEEFGDRTLRFQARAPLSAGVEWDPTFAWSRGLRRSLNGGSRTVSGKSLENRLIASFAGDWQLTLSNTLSRYDVAGQEEPYTRVNGGFSLVRFLSHNGRLEAGAGVGRLSGPEEQNILLVDVLGSARPGTSYNTTAAASFEPGEQVLIHVRYTGRTDYLLDRFVNHGRAEVKYFF